MKNLFTWFLCLSMLMLGSCKGDDPAAPVKKFADYTRADILAQANNITTYELAYNHQGVTNFKIGSIIFFKTNAINYGKIEILNVDASFNLKVNLVVYDTNGAVLLGKNAFVLANNINSYDLDDPDMPVAVNNNFDLTWFASNGIYTLYFGNGAKAYLFKP